MATEKVVGENGVGEKKVGEKIVGENSWWAKKKVGENAGNQFSGPKMGVYMVFMPF